MRKSTTLRTTPEIPRRVEIRRRRKPLQMQKDPVRVFSHFARDNTRLVAMQEVSHSRHQLHALRRSGLYDRILIERDSGL